MAVGLQPFEDCLAVMQEVGSGVETQRAVGNYLGVMPPLLCRPGGMHHVIRGVLGEARIRQDLCTAFIGRGCGIVVDINRPER